MMRIELKKSGAFLINILLLALSNKAQAIEFNSDVLKLDEQENIDLSIFEKTDALTEGEYYVDILINGKRVPGQERIQFKPNPQNNAIQACIPLPLIDRLGLEKNIVDKIKDYNDDCLGLYQIDSNISTSLNQENQELLITIPQAYFKYDDAEWIPPKQRDDGVSGAIFDYTINQTYSKSAQDKAVNNFTAYGTAGFNAGAWRVRADYQYQHNDRGTDNQSSFKWDRAYAFRDIGSLNAKLTVGDDYLDTNIFDRIKFRGASLITDEQMLPQQLRGYAPAVTGIARTNAVVTIRQDGRLLQQVQVSPGPFNINDISASVSGTLDIEVKEENGEIQTYQAHAVNAPFLTRSGQTQYKISAGEFLPTQNELIKNYRFFSAEASFGLTNRTSLFGGILGTVSNNDYTAYNLGIGQNLGSLGAVSLDITKSINRAKEKQGKQVGNSYRFHYSKKFDSSNSQINFLGYRFSDKNFTSINQFLNGISSQSPLYYYKREKNQFTINFSQYIKAVDLSFQLSGSKYTYWDGDNSESFTASLYSSIKKGALKGLNYSFSTSRYTNASSNSFSSKVNKQYMFTLSLPIGSKKSIYYNLDYDTENKKTNQNISYSQLLDNEKTDIGLGLSSEDFGAKNTTIRGHIAHQSPIGDIRVVASYNKNYQFASSSFSGSVTATKAGVALSPLVFKNQARVMISADNVPNISISDNRVITNRFGLAVVPNVNTYRYSSVSVDIDKMPQDASVDDSVVNIGLTAGAIGYQKITADSGEQLVGQIRLDDQSYPSFGTFIYNEQTGRESGMVSDYGQAYITGVKPNSSYLVKWKNGSCRIQIQNSQYSPNGLNEFKCIKKESNE